MKFYLKILYIPIFFKKANFGVKRYLIIANEWSHSLNWIVSKWRICLYLNPIIACPTMRVQFHCAYFWTCSFKTITHKSHIKIEIFRLKECSNTRHSFERKNAPKRAKKKKKINFVKIKHGQVVVPHSYCLPVASDQTHRDDLYLIYVLRIIETCPTLQYEARCVIIIEFSTVRKNLRSKIKIERAYAANPFT